jgi:hypothetical protein
LGQQEWTTPPCACAHILSDRCCTPPAEIKSLFQFNPSNDKKRHLFQNHCYHYCTAWLLFNSVSEIATWTSYRILATFNKRSYSVPWKCKNSKNLFTFMSSKSKHGKNQSLKGLCQTQPNIFILTFHSNVWLNHDILKLKNKFRNPLPTTVSQTMNFKYPSFYICTQLVEALYYKPEGRRFDSRWGNSIFQLI